MGLFDKIFGPPTRDRFARMMMKAIRAAGESRPMTYDPQQFALACERQTFNMANAYEEYCTAARGDRQAFVKRYTRTWFLHLKGIPDEFDDAKPDLLPRIRDRAYFDRHRLYCQINDLESGSAYRVCSEHFAIGIVYDMPEAVAEISQSQLSEWKVRFDEALEIAEDNLREMGGAFAALDGHVYVSAMHDNHDATRIMLLDLIRQLEVQGDYVAMVPNRDHLIVTGTDDAAGLVIMAALAEEALKASRPMSGIAVRLEGDHWYPYLPSDDHPAAVRLKLLRLQSLGQDYSEQKDLLDRLHAKQGEDVFVATFSAIQDTKTEKITTYCVWADGVATMLPRTDMIAFLRDSKSPPLNVPWQQAYELLADLMVPVEGIFPERYRVDSFPTDAQMAQLKGFAE